MLYLLPPVYYKGYIAQDGQTENTYVPRYRREEISQAATPSPGTPPSQNLKCSPTQKPPDHYLLGVLMEVSLHKQDRFNHWPFMIELNLQPLFPSLEVGKGSENPKLLIMAWSFW